MLALTACAAVALAACSSSGGSTGSTQAAAASTTAVAGPSTAAASSGSSASCPATNKTRKLHLAFVYSSTDENPFQEMADGAREAAAEDGNTDIQLDAPPTVDGPAEVQMLQSVSQTAKDGIAWQSATPNLFVRPLQQVKAAGIPLVAVDNNTPPGVSASFVVSNSNFEVGAALGNAFVAQHPNPAGTVVIGIDQPTLGVLQDRVKGLESVIKAHFPKMTIVGPFDAKLPQSENTQAWQAQINAHPTAEAFLGIAGPDGVSLPLLKAKTHGTWLAGSSDIAPQALEGVKSGALFALSSPEHFMKGYIAVHELVEHARTCQALPSGWWNSGTLLIDKSNVDQIIQREKNPSTMLAWYKQKSIPEQLASPPLQPISKLN